MSSTGLFFKVPDSIHVSVYGGRWSLSCNAATGRAEPDEVQTLAALKMLSAEELAPLTLGLDRGVTVPRVVECSEPVEAIPPTYVEIAVSRLGSQEPVLRSRKREPPTTTAAAV